MPISAKKASSGAWLLRPFQRPNLYGIVVTHLSQVWHRRTVVGKDGATPVVLQEAM
jgi:hypothetical protein